MKSIITSVSAHQRVTNNLVKKINNAVSFFSEAPIAEEEETPATLYKTVIVRNAESHILSFAEIDTVREVLDEYKKKYRGIFYVMGTRPYLAKDGETWLSEPVIEVNIRIFTEEEKNAMK